MAAYKRSMLSSARLRPQLYGIYPAEGSVRHGLPLFKHAQLRGAPHLRNISAKTSESNTPTDGSSTATGPFVIRRIMGKKEKLQDHVSALREVNDESDTTRKIVPTTRRKHHRKGKPASQIEVFEKLESTESLWDSNGEPFISSILLRDSCRCDQCIDPSTKQRTFSFHEIPDNVQARDGGKTDDGRTILKWENDINGFDEHFSTFSLAELQAVARGGTMSLVRDDQPKLTEQWDATSIAEKLMTMSYEDYMSSDKHLLIFLKALKRDGLAFVKGVPSPTESIKQIVERIGPIRNTFYGSTWDVKSKPNAENVAYTDKELGFHMDLLYMDSPPHLQYLHCIQNTCTGGESRFIDCIRARGIMESEHPEQADLLQRVHFRYHYQNMGHFYTSRRPVFTIKDRLWWSPPFVNTVSFDPTKAGESKSIPEVLSAVKLFASILDRKDLVYQTKMEEGVCVIFENTRILHARSAFDVNSGNRWLRGAYLDRQPLNSTYSRLTRGEAADMASAA